MASHNSQTSTNSGLNFGLLTIPQSLILELGTVSVLMLVTAHKATHEALIAMGQASEEIFRGDRLPILDFPDSKLEK